MSDYDTEDACIRTLMSVPATYCTLTVCEWRVQLCLAEMDSVCANSKQVTWSLFQWLVGSRGVVILARGGRLLALCIMAHHVNCIHVLTCRHVYIPATMQSDTVGTGG